MTKKTRSRVRSYLRNRSPAPEKTRLRRTTSDYGTETGRRTHMLMDRIEEEGRQIGRGRQGAGNSGREAESRRRRRCHQIEGRRRRSSREEEPTSRIRSERESARLRLRCDW
jgi:hypothetical protein